MYSERLAGGPMEIIRIPDARGLAEGYNRGLARSRGDYVIFSDDDVEFLAPDFREKLLGHMRYCDILGIAGTRLLTAPGWRMAGPPHLYGQIASHSPLDPSQFTVTFWSVPGRRIDCMQALDGLFLCTARTTAARIGFDQQNFTAGHLHDIDFTYRAFLGGLRLSVALDLCPVDHSPEGYGRDWIPHAQGFMKKFAGRIAVRPAPSFHNTTAPATTREDVRNMMTPPHWGD
jgi:GT2 family glycosyltransferase